MKSGLRAVALVSAFLAMAAAAAAQTRTQEQQESGDGARFRWGPLHFTPGIAITDVGVDSNVFNSSDHPVSDSLASIGPAVNAWLKLGPVRVAEKSAGQYLYFKESENQRSWNTLNELKLDVPLARFRPFAIGSYVNTRQREGFEIDARARASTNLATLGTDVRLSGKTTLVLSGTRTTLAYDRSETFLGTDLAASLNRHSDGELGQLRFALTPLTTLVFTGEAVQDRFDTERFRNADSFSVRPGFEFKPFALISGKVSVGYRHFNVLSDAIKDYQGVVANVDARYMLTTSTQVTAKFNRDIAFSYEDALPYYTFSEAKLAITRRLGSSWDVVGSGARQLLGYRGLAADPSAAHIDTGRVVGFGVGYLVGDTFRIGIDVNSYSRRSVISQRNYDGVRAGASVTYGIQR